MLITVLGATTGSCRWPDGCAVRVLVSSASDVLPGVSDVATRFLGVVFASFAILTTHSSTVSHASTFNNTT